MQHNRNYVAQGKTIYPKGYLKTYEVNMKRLSGFSLMEMMIVLLIVSIVAAASAPMVNKKLLTAASEKSPWVWTGLDNSIAYNLNGNNNSSALIGCINTPQDADNARLYIDSTTSDGQFTPQISFGQGGANILNLRAFNRNFFVSSNDDADMNNSASNAVAIGFNSYADSESVAIGNDANSANVSSVAVGANSSGDLNAVAVGSSSNAFGARSIAIGFNSTASSADAVSIGNSTSANVTAAIAIGDGAQATGESGVAIAKGSVASNNRTIAIGLSASATNAGAIAIGEGTIASGGSSIAIGSLGNDSLITKATGAHAIAIGDVAEATNARTVAVGPWAKANVGNTVALGVGAIADNYDAIAIGRNSTASGESSIAIGSYCDGVNTTASGNASVAIGDGATAWNNRSVAIGEGATTTDINQIVLGRDSDTVYIRGRLVVDGETIVNRIRGNFAFRPAATATAGSTGLAYLEGNQSTTSGGYEVNYCDAWGYLTPDSVNLSDRRLKNVGKAFIGGLKEIKQLETFNYTFKKDPTKTPRVGVMAQDLQKIFPQAVFKGEDGFLRIRMEDMFYAMVNAIKELDLKIENLKNQEILILKNRVDKLEKDNKILEKRIIDLEKKIKQN